MTGRTWAIGSYVSEDVYDQVVGEGRLWVDRAFVVNNWHIAAYEPVWSITGKIIASSRSTPTSRGG